MSDLGFVDAFKNPSTDVRSGCLDEQALCIQPKKASRQPVQYPQVMLRDP